MKLAHRDGEVRQSESKSVASVQNETSRKSSRDCQRSSDHKKVAGSHVRIRRDYQEEVRRTAVRSAVDGFVIAGCLVDSSVR